MAPAWRGLRPLCSPSSLPFLSVAPRSGLGGARRGALSSLSPRMDPQPSNANYPCKKVSPGDVTSWGWEGLSDRLPLL